MSLRLAALENTNFNTSFSVSKTFGDLEERRILAIKNERRRAESLAGLESLYKALDGRSVGDIARNSEGRPFFVGDTGIDFSISHSGKLSVAALLEGSIGRVGVDIEKIDEKKEDTHKRIAERYFSDEEKLAFLNSSSPLEFYKIWTAKEARAKFFGFGLAQMLSTHRSAKKDEDASVLHVLLTCKNEKYVLAVCTAKDEKIDFICGNGISVSANNVN